MVEPADETGDRAMNRRRFLTATAAGLSTPALAINAAAEGSAETVTIVHDTHFHGHIGEPEGLNIARYLTAIEEQLAVHENALFLGNGDDIAPSLLSFFTEGQHMIEFLNDLPMTADAVGNHEFDYGVEVAEQRFADSEFPWLSANVLTPDDEPIPGTERWMTTEVGGITLGIFGLAPRDTHALTSLPEEYTVLDPVEASEEAVDALIAEGADAVVLASHLSHGTHYEVAEAVSGLDAIVGSHSNVVFDEPEVVSGTVISEVGDEFDHLGIVTLDSDGDLVEWERIDLDEGVEPDPDFLSRIEEWQAFLDDELGEEIGQTATELDASGLNYGHETALGNLITDAMLAHFEDADVSFQNAGGIRTDETYGPGTLTAADVMSILPFPNSLVLVEATGSDIRSVLEGRIETLPDGEYGAQQGQQVGGLQYEWYAHGEPRVGDVYVDGEPLDEEETYLIATIDYIHESASGYEALRENEVVRADDLLQGPMVIEYIQERSCVDPEIEHRILRVDEDVGSGEVSGGSGGPEIRFDAPEHVLELTPESFFAVAPDGTTVQATEAALSDGEVVVSFDGSGFGEVTSAAAPKPLRVFGGFEPDEDGYNYDRELPAAAGWEYFVLRGTVEADD
jgi:5'-nucleotidase / UDP-sugar diphosphatase